MKTLNRCFKGGAALAGLTMAFSLLAVIWMPGIGEAGSLLFKQVFSTGLISALVCMFGVLFTWDGSL